MSYCIYERDGVEQNCGIKGYVIQFLIRYNSSAGGLALGVPCTIYISYLSLLETICYSKHHPFTIQIVLLVIGHKIPLQ